MKQQNFTCSITVNISPQKAQEHIARVSAWWAKDFEGCSQSLGDVFTVRFGETFVTFKIAEFVAGKKIVWRVTDCNLHWLAEKKEWMDTAAVWEIFRQGATTEVKFTHEGLVPGKKCYGRCKQGWTQHVTESLFKLMNEGKGTPKS